jgi:ribonuclease HI
MGGMPSIHQQKCHLRGGFSVYISRIELQIGGEGVGVGSYYGIQKWNQRNHVVFGGSILLPRCLMVSARESLDAFQQASCIYPVSVVDASAIFSKWEKPDSGWIKINWDASVDKAAQVMGVGVVTRDFMGRVCASLCTALSYISDPSTAEALAARMGVEFSKAMGFRRIWLEGDAKVVVDALKSTGLQSPRFGNIIEDTRLLAQGFSDWQVSYVNRNSNIVAHLLACLAVQQGLHRVWIESFPDSISASVCTDLGCSP